MSSLRREWGARSAAVGRVSPHLILCLRPGGWCWEVCPLHIYTVRSQGLCPRERGCHRSWQCWGFEDGGHLASVAGEFQVPGVGSQPLTVLERGARLSNTFSLLPSREVEGLAIRGISKSLSLQLKGRNQGQRDQSEGQPWLKCPCPRPSHIFCGPPAGLDGLRIWGVRDRV